jgi:hypothetical protein
MITPSFKLEQNANYLFINIRAPYVKVSCSLFKISHLLENLFGILTLPRYMKPKYMLMKTILDFIVSLII